MKKRVAILGSTGSIGTQTLDVIDQHRDLYEVTALAAGHDTPLLQEQIRAFSPKHVFVASNQDASILTDLATMDEADFVVIATVGLSALEATIGASTCGKTIAIANKETLVSAGEIINKNCKESGARLHPIDSEHSAIWQCLLGEGKPRKIILTASGGPFRKTPKSEMPSITPEQALKHPSWNMGKKVTIDSSTLMNKGFEIIEAYRLFGTAIDQIEVLVHPQSIIHSMVEFADGAIKAQLGVPDMRIPIQFALSYPERLPNPAIPAIDLDTLTSMTFERPDNDRFPCLGLAVRAITLGKTYPTVLCAADDIAVEAFLDRKIKYTDIPAVIEDALSHHKALDTFDAQDIRKITTETHEYVRSLCQGR
jgi:1-deoxy-D-xylulose-5-phosphate reductoisomerase